ncbi:hypothetical protein ACFL27_12010, partial [candidate division CSSED10-310 bacterium]
SYRSWDYKFNTFFDGGLWEAKIHLQLDIFLGEGGSPDPPIKCILTGQEIRSPLRSRLIQIY